MGTKNKWFCVDIHCPLIHPFTVTYLRLCEYSLYVWKYSILGLIIHFQIKRLEKQVKIRDHELEVKTQEGEDMEKSLLERQTMLQQSSARITELEDMQAALQRQVSVR